jgi:GNAT superfamily N-acetyltransferase
MPEPDTRVQYRRMAAADLPFVVDQHLYHFPDGFFARLGPAFLSEYYRAFLTGPSVSATIAEIEGRPVGYLVGVSDPAWHREHVVRRHGRSLALKAATAMLLHPSLGLLFLHTRVGLYARKLLRRRSQPQPSPAAPPAGRTAVLTHVAIAPGAQSRGIGSELIRRFDEEVAAIGCTRITLVTASGVDGAGPYYEHRGWTACGERCTPDGLWLTTYQRPCGADPVGEGTVTYPPRSEDTA